MVKRKPKPRKRSNPDQKLREWIFEVSASPEIAGDIAVANAELWFQWIKHGKPPGLRVVGGKEASA
jgi:hypothetical protein